MEFSSDLRRMVDEFGYERSAYLSGRLVRWRGGAQPMEVVADGLDSPTAVAVGADGEIYVSKEFAGRVVRITNAPPAGRDMRWSLGGTLVGGAAAAVAVAAYALRRRCYTASNASALRTTPMAMQSLEREVRVVRDDMQDVKDILRDLAVRTVALAERMEAAERRMEASDRRMEAADRRMEALEKVVAANAEQIAALEKVVAVNAEQTAANDRQIAANQIQIAATAKQLESTTHEVELLAKAAVTYWGNFRAEYEPGPSGRSDDWEPPFANK